MQKINRYKLLFLFAFSLFAFCGNEKTHEHVGHDPQQHQEVYTCSMHPEIIRNSPGLCPVCGMDLVKKETGSNAGLSPELEALLKPANEFAVSTITSTTLEYKEEDIELKVVGTVAYDTRQSGSISSRVKGRIEKLYIRFRYQPVSKGQRIMDIYSPELVTAQQNLIFLLINDPDNTSMINAAKDRLLLLGMTSNQVAEVARSKTPKYSVIVYSNYSGFVTDMPTSANSTPSDAMQAQTSANEELSVKQGMYVQSSQPVFTVYNPAKAWILLDIFPEQQNLVKIGHKVRIVPETAPQQNFRAMINYIEPIFRPEAKTLTARVYINNAAMQLPIGSRVTATIFAPSINASWLPKEAVLSLGRDKIVFRKEPGGFRAHKVTTGMELNRLIQVVTGLSPKDSVASNAQFLVDNEAFIKVNNK